MIGNIVLNDNVKSIYGTASDGLEIYHDGSHSYLKDSGTGDLKISSNTVRIESDGAENMIIASANGAVNLYYNNNNKLATTNTGATITGALTTTTNVTVGANATFVDNGKALFGASSDLEIYHSGTDSFIANATGDLKLSSTNFRILKPGLGEFIANFFSDGANEFFYDGTKRLETVTDGAKVTGNLEVTGTITGSGGSFLPLIGGDMSGNTTHDDNAKSFWGDANDLGVYHDGINSYISDTGAGSLYVQGSNIFIQSSINKNAIICGDSDSVELYFNASKKFETTNTGISVTGNVVPTGNVHVQDAGQLQLGTGINGKIYHDGLILLQKFNRSIKYRPSSSNRINSIQNIRCKCFRCNCINYKQKWRFNYRT